MLRSNYVRAGESAAHEKAPAEATAEASEKCQCRLLETDDAFNNSFLLIMQCRDVVQEIDALWRKNDGRSLSELQSWEIDHICRTVAAAAKIARECSRFEILSNFEAVFGISYDSFWADIKNLRHFACGGA